MPYIFSEPTDFDLVSDIARRLFDDKNLKLIRFNDLQEYYSDMDMDVQEIVSEWCIELEDLITNDVHRNTIAKNYDNLSISLHRILGAARYMFADKLVFLCVSYIDTLSIVRQRVMPKHNGERKAAQMIVSLNLMLRQVITETKTVLKEFQQNGVIAGESMVMNFMEMGNPSMDGRNR